MMSRWNELTHRLFIQRLARDLKFRKTKHKIPPINMAEHIGVLWTHQPDMDPSEMKKRLAEWEGSGSKIEAFCFYPSLKKEEEMMFPGITGKETNWLGVPKWESIQEFVNKPFDLLIIPDPNPGHTIQYIQAQSVARFKIGTVNNPGQDLHLRIDTTPPFRLVTFWEDLRFLLEKLSLPV